MAATPDTVSPTNDDALTVCAVSLLSVMLANVLHEGLGHGTVALMTGAQSGVLTTVAWSSAFDSRLVAAGGTLANLAARIVFWIALRSAKRASVHLRFFLLTSVAFNLLAGNGYFFFSGVTNFGDWAVVIADLHAHWLWRALLVIIGMAAHYVAILVVGTGLVRYVGVPRTEPRRVRKLTFIPYWEGTGVEPDVVTKASDALIAVYKLALKDAKPSVESEELTKERQLAVQDPQAALAEEITGFQKN